MCLPPISWGKEARCKPTQPTRLSFVHLYKVRGQQSIRGVVCTQKTTTKWSNNQNTQRLWRMHSSNISNYHYGSQGYFSGKDGGTSGVSGCVQREQRQVGSFLEDAKCRSTSSSLAGREYILALIQNNKPHTLLHHKEY